MVRHNTTLNTHITILLSDINTYGSITYVFFREVFSD